MARSAYGRGWWALAALPRPGDSYRDDGRLPDEGLSRRTFLTFSLRRLTGTPAFRSGIAWRRRIGRSGRPGAWSAGAVAERTSVEPLLRRRSRSIAIAVRPSQTNAAPITRKTAGIVSMIKSRSDSVSTLSNYASALGLHPARPSNGASLACSSGLAVLIFAFTLAASCRLGSRRRYRGRRRDHRYLFLGCLRRRFCFGPCLLRFCCCGSGCFLLACFRGSLGGRLDGGGEVGPDSGDTGHDGPAPFLRNLAAARRRRYVRFQALQGCERSRVIIRCRCLAYAQHQFLKVPGRVRLQAGIGRGAACHGRRQHQGRGEAGSPCTCSSWTGSPCTGPPNGGMKPGHGSTLFCSSRRWSPSVPVTAG